MFITLKLSKAVNVSMKRILDASSKTVTSFIVTAQQVEKQQVFKRRPGATKPDKKDQHIRRTSSRLAVANTPESRAAKRQQQSKAKQQQAAELAEKEQLKMAKV